MAENSQLVDVAGEKFGCILNCAVRYAIGRETYMPGLVIGFIQPLLKHISDNTLYVFDQDITDQKYTGGYGNKDIDEPLWLKFHQEIISEEKRRKLTPYKDWRRDEG